MIPLSWYILLSAALFTIGVVGVLSRRNVFIILMSIELMLNAANINLIAFSHYLQNLTGQIFAIFVITVAAAEAKEVGALPELRLQPHRERERRVPRVRREDRIKKVSG